MFCFQRALCCFPGFSNTGATSRKGKIPKPLLAGVESAGGSSTASSKSRLLEDSGESGGGGGAAPGAVSGILEFAAAASRFKSRLSDGKPEDMMLLEKQGRSSQRQRMQESSAKLAGEQEPRRAGSLPPSSLPRPPRSLKSHGSSRYCRLSDSEARKKPEAAEYALLRRKRSSESIPLSAAKPHSQPADKHREAQARSLIPPPSRRTNGPDYGRLSDAGPDAKHSPLSSRGQSTASIHSTKSDAPAMLKPNNRSIPRPSNYRIHF